MTDATDPFADLTRRGHQLFAAAVQAWEQAARSLAEARRPGGPPQAEASLEAAFDFAAQMLAEQREFAKALMAVSSQAVSTAARRARSGAEPDATVSGERPERGFDPEPGIAAIEPASEDSGAAPGTTVAAEPAEPRAADETASPTGTTALSGGTVAATPRAPAQAEDPARPAHRSPVKKAAKAAPAKAAARTAVAKKTAATKAVVKKTAATKAEAKKSVANTGVAKKASPTKAAAPKKAATTTPAPRDDAG